MGFNNYDDFENREYRERLFQDTLEKCSRKSIKYISRSKYYKMINILLVTITIIISSVLGVILAVQQQDYISATLSFSITFFTLIHQAFKIGTLGVYYRHYGLQIKKMQRNLIRTIKNNEDIDIKDIDKLVDSINEELDDIGMSLFSQTYGPKNITAAGDEGEINMDDSKVESPNNV